MVLIVVGLFVLAVVLSVGPRVARRRSRLDAYLGVPEERPDTRGRERQPRVWVVFLGILVLFGVILAGLGYLVYMWLEGWST
jgi:ABC-type Fe3+ transport system permease subunit